MSKPVKDWTLGELKEYCLRSVGKDACLTRGCPFKKICDDITRSSDEDNVVPGDWDLTNPPKWTKEDVERAKMLIELIPEAKRLERGATVIHVRGDSGGAYFCALDSDRFPSIKIGEIVKLEEIINAKTD